MTFAPGRSNSQRRTVLRVVLAGLAIGASTSGCAVDPESSDYDFSGPIASSGEDRDPNDLDHDGIDDDDELRREWSTCSCFDFVAGDIDPSDPRVRECQANRCPELVVWCGDTECRLPDDEDWECALKTFEGDEPGIIEWSLTYDLEKADWGMLYVDGQGNVEAFVSQIVEPRSDYSAIRSGTLRPLPVFESCFASEDPSARVDCLRDPFADETTVCRSGGAVNLW